MKPARTHVVIGDTQVREGVPTKHLTWIGRYIADQFAGKDVSIVHLGDHWDMPSLSSYDKGKKAMEGRRYLADIKAGNAGWGLLNAPLDDVRRWKPDLHFLLGNHENRIERAVENDAQLEGAVSLDHLATLGWQVHDFLKPVRLDGVTYAHYFYNPSTGKPYGGENLYTRLKTIGRSFTMGHQQGVSWAIRQVASTRHQGLVLGSSYLHDEKYMGPQGNHYWRGIVVCHQVRGGTYDPMFVSLEYLCQRYEKRSLKEYLRSVA